MLDEDLHVRLERHHTACYGWALHCADNDPAEAEDVLQVAYVEVLEGRARFGGRSRFRTWLFGVIRNVAANRRRRRQRRARLLRRRQEELRPTKVAYPADAEAAARERNEQLRRALGQLSRRQGEVIVLTFYENMTIEEAGEVLGISLGSARTHYHRAKARLRELLTDPEEAE